MLGNQILGIQNLLGPSKQMISRIMSSDDYEYDVFISYAVEDKSGIVTELVQKLEEAGVRVWYAFNQFVPGKSVHETIREGLKKSKYGVVILSPGYFAKEWPKKELHALWARESASERVIIPIWHQINEEQIKSIDPILADKYGIPSSLGIDTVVRRLIRTIHEERPPEPKGETLLTRKFVVRFLMVFIPGALSIFGYFFFLSDKPAAELIDTTISKRIETFQRKLMNEHQQELKRTKGIAVTPEEIIGHQERYDSLSVRYRNQYYFENGYTRIRSRKNVEPALKTDVELMGPENNYGFEYPNMYLIDKKPDSPRMGLKYIYINTQPVAYRVSNTESMTNSRYLIRVIYQNNLRYISVDLTYSERSQWMKRRQITFRGFLPEEIYEFKKKGHEWVFSGLN